MNDPRNVLKAHGLWSKKHFGQNFLVAPDMPERIAAAGGVGKGDVVFEIGAGVGTLTLALARRAGRVIALEHDRDLVPVLKAELAAFPHVEIREGNVLEHDYTALRAEVGQPLLVYGNIPYNLSTDILVALLMAEGTWTRACLLLQREFALRVAAAPGDKACGSLSALTALKTWATVQFEVPANAFHPAPKVESAVLVLERRERPPVDVGDERSFRKVVKALFGQRRKMARKALESITPEPEAILATAGLEGTRRGETFTLEELAALSRALTA